MAANKYLSHSAGAIQEVTPATTGGAGDENKIPALDANGRLAVGMMPSGLGPETQTLAASEALAAGDFINVWDDTGTLKMRKADASADKPAHGFVLAVVENGANGLAHFDGINNQCAGLSGGPIMYLSAAAPGTATATPPSASTNYVQRLGTRLSATEIAFVPDLTIIKLA
jgi:hypothetical protein